MKVTIDLPDELVTEMKIRAAKEKRRLKDVAATAISRGLKDTAIPAVGTSGEKPLTPEQQERLDAFQRLVDYQEANPITPERKKALDDYLVELREDRDTFWRAGLDAASRCEYLDSDRAAGFADAFDSRCLDGKR